MKLTKLLSKVMVISIITTGAFITTAVFADEVATTPVVEGQQTEKIKLSPQEKILNISEEHAPDTLTAWEDIFNSKESIKTEIQVLKSKIEPLKELHKEEIKAELKAENDAFLADLNAKIDSGEITQEEADDLYDTAKDSRIAAAETRRVEKELKKEEVLATREAKKTERQQLKEMMKLAVEADNTIEISTILDEMLTNALEVQTNGYNKINTLTERLAELQN